MYTGTMKWFSFLVIILGLTSRKSLAGLVIGAASNKYEESSNVRNAVSFSSTTLRYFKYNVTAVSNFFGFIIILNPHLISKIFKHLVVARCHSHILSTELYT